jgi:hypothetical protein
VALEIAQAVQQLLVLLGREIRADILAALLLMAAVVVVDQVLLELTAFLVVKQAVAAQALFLLLLVLQFNMLAAGAEVLMAEAQ